MHQLTRVASFKSRWFILEYADGLKLFGWRYSFRRAVHAQINNGEITATTDPEHLKRIKQAADWKDGFYVDSKSRKQRGWPGLDQMKDEEKAHFQQIRTVEKDRALRRGISGVIPIRCLNKKQKTYRGGAFLWIKIAKNNQDHYGWRAEYKKAAPEWDVASPEGEVVAIVGIGREHGQLVFAVDGKLYSRVSRHKVQGRKISSYSKYYKRHPQAWGKAGRMVLKPFKGEMIHLSE